MLKNTSCHWGNYENLRWLKTGSSESMRSAACFSKGCNTTVYVCERYVTWLRLARESTYKFAGLHHKGGSEKLRNVVSFVRLRKGRMVKTTLRRIGRLWSFYLIATPLYKQELRKTAFKSLRSGQKTHPVLFYTNDGFARGYLNSCSAELFVCGSFISSQSASAQTFPRNSLHSTGFLFYIPNFGVWRQPLSASGIFATSWYVEFLIS